MIFGLMFLISFCVTVQASQVSMSLIDAESDLPILSFIPLSNNRGYLTPSILSIKKSTSETHSVTSKDSAAKQKKDFFLGVASSDKVNKYGILLCFGGHSESLSYGNLQFEEHSIPGMLWRKPFILYKNTENKGENTVKLYDKATGQCIFKVNETQFDCKTCASLDYNILYRLIENLSVVQVNIRLAFKDKEILIPHTTRKDTQCNKTADYFYSTGHDGVISYENKRGELITFNAIIDQLIKQHDPKAQSMSNDSSNPVNPETSSAWINNRYVMSAGTAFLCAAYFYLQGKK